MVRYYLSGNYPDSALMVLDSFVQLEAKYIKCASLLALGMAEEAESALMLVPNSPGESIETYLEGDLETRNSTIVEQDVWYELLEWWYGFVEDSLTYADADPEDIGFLRDISALDNAISIYAEAMLAAIGDTVIYHGIEPFDSTWSAKRGDEAPPAHDQPWLGQNIPNPFDGSTLIPVFLPEGTAWLEVHDLNGRLVWSQSVNNGLNHVVIQGPDLPKGVYAYSLRVGEKAVATRKMIRQ